MKILTPAERLIVAADFKAPEENFWIEQGPYSGTSLICRSKIAWVKRQVLALADSLKGTGVYLKVNSALRACGSDLIGEIHSRGLKVFADLKLFDISETLSIDGILLSEAKPELLTVVCGAGVAALRSLKTELPNTEVLGVTVLTSLKDEDTMRIFTCTREEAVIRFAQLAVDAKIDGLICSPKEAKVLRTLFGGALTLNTPAVRPAWSVVPGDDQNPDLIMTPTKAIKASADRIVVGRPITKPPQGMTSYDAVMRIIEEIDTAEIPS